MAKRQQFMKKIAAKRMLLVGVVIATNPAWAAEQDETDEIELLKQRVDQLEQQLAEQNQARVVILEEEDDSSEIDIGGAVRFQYNYNDYDEVNKNQAGGMALDTLRLNFDGELGGMILSAEYRYYDYMQVVHHAWVGYQFSDTTLARAGIIKVPFGNQPYNSNNFFFSSNYYLGLEDDYDLGVGATYETTDWQLDLAFLKNDELGGSASNDRYSYDVVGTRLPGEGIYDDPNVITTESNTIVARATHRWSRDGLVVELGASALAGSLVRVGDDGDYHAWAAHMNTDWGPWNIKLQVSQYDYSLPNDTQQMVVGAYAFYDTIAAEATTFTAGIARAFDWQVGPITGLTLYSDFSQVGDKSGGLADTWMNVTGLAISAGPVYTYVDFVTARNQPFIGGTMGTPVNGEVDHRFNINVGYYF